MALLAMCALGVACGDDADGAPARMPGSPQCPPGLSPDPARARQVYDRLRSVPAGADSIAALDGAPPPVCFGDTEVSVVTAEGVLWLDDRMGSAEAAARVAHLLHHLAAMPDLDSPGAAGCEPLIAEAMEVERRSVALELRLRRALGVVDPVTELRTDGLEAAYRQRCESALRAGPAGG